MLANRQPEAGAFETAGDRTVRLTEREGQFLFAVRIDPDAAVDDRDFERDCQRIGGDRPDVDRDPPGTSTTSRRFCAGYGLFMRYL